MPPQESATDLSNIGLIWRGALGGVLGAPIFLAAFVIHEKRTTGYVAYGGALQIQALPMFLLFGASVGAAIGGIILLAVTKLGRTKLPAIIRAMIGVSFMLVVVGILQVIQKDRSYLVPLTPSETVAYMLMWVISFGALPGIAAWPGKSKDKTRNLS
jgi:hypothetical protein